MKHKPIILLFLIAIQCTCLQLRSCNYSSKIEHNPALKTIKISDSKQNLSLLIDYSNGCKITELLVKEKNTLSNSGIYTGISTKDKLFYSSIRASNIKVSEGKESITLIGIDYGDKNIMASETWTFKLVSDKIHWNILREYSNSEELDEMAFPQWSFSNLSLWKGGIIDNGGMVWCKYLSGVNDSYGVHTGGVTLWNAENGNALRITAKPNKDNFIATKYSHSDKNEFTVTHFVTDKKIEQRYGLSRFVHNKSDLFSPFEVTKGSVSINIELEYIDYFTEYSRGMLTGIDANAVRELLNTTGRYGVVDNNIVGGNGWTTNWKCLHEPFFSQIGIALNDKNYIDNMSATLDQERDLALLPNGRVLSRWHNAPGDEIQGTFNTKTGYYEAMWGYTIDSQTGYVINTSEQFDLCGDVNWLLTHKESCEKALDWLINRDSNNNGIFEMINNNIDEKKASDWLDIVWASFENSFVNAQMYEALELWANCERILGDKKKEKYYSNVALRLKTAFNKSIKDGGFWSPEKNQYVYWRDKDGSVHGDNLVTPVNFAAIAFGICDNPLRISLILEEIEKRTTMENLFHWPLCFDSYKQAEVHENNWPFPKYENGDIFPTWGYLGVRAYISYDKSIALKYIRNLIQQYNKDGLSSQRYSRITQQGLGDDILAGICTSIVSLYRDIYGIRPKWNRMGLEPNMSEDLNGTDFSYTLRNTNYNIKLSVNDYVISTDEFKVRSKYNFGVSMAENILIYYPDNRDDTSFKIKSTSKSTINIDINNWTRDFYSWTIKLKDKYEFVLTGLDLNSKYELSTNNTKQYITTKNDGSLSIMFECTSPTIFNIKKVN